MNITPAPHSKSAIYLTGFYPSPKQLVIRMTPPPPLWICIYIGWIQAEEEEKIIL